MMYKYLHVLNDLESMIQNGRDKRRKEITVYTVTRHAI